jgi:hypothetical protein
MDHDKLSFWKHEVMGRQFLVGVRTLRRIDHPADCGNIMGLM